MRDVTEVRGGLELVSVVAVQVCLCPAQRVHVGAPKKASCCPKTSREMGLPAAARQVTYYTPKTGGVASTVG